MNPLRNNCSPKALIIFPSTLINSNKSIRQLYVVNTKPLGLTCCQMLSSSCEKTPVEDLKSAIFPEFSSKSTLTKDIKYPIWTNFTIIALNSNFLHSFHFSALCVRLIDVLSANQHVKIFARILLYPVQGE